jgi:endo-1,4-beta-xylanase
MDIHDRSDGSRKIESPYFTGAFLLLALAAVVTAQESLGSLAAKRGVYVGAAIGGTFWNIGADARYRETMKREFNILVAENAMKFEPLENQRNKFNWKQADELAAYAASNGMALRGHNLVWHQASGWLEAATGLDRAEMLAILKNHIDSVAGRYRGKILEWDVVNEAVDDAAGLRNTFWLQRVGADYLDSAFTWAHRADPEAYLFYNDYSGEGMGGKADRIFALVKGMKEKGVPIHGVGLQCHFASGAAFAVDDIDKNIKRLGALGLRVSVTELDFRMKLPADSAARAVQKDNYYRLLKTCLANPNCKTFLTWGFTDAYSWVPGFFTGFGDALPFDAAYKSKPAYEGMRQALMESVSIRNHERRSGGSAGRGDAYTGTFADGLHAGYRDAIGRWTGSR